MPKRKLDDKIKRYKEKIKKLEIKSKKRRRLAIDSDTESDIEKQDINENLNSYEPEMTENLNLLPPLSNDILPIEDLSLPIDPPLQEDAISKIIESSELPKSPNKTLQEPNELESIVDQSTELDPEIRLALGDPIEDSPKYGDSIHSDLAQRWLPILKKGLAKDTKEKLLKEYNYPDNCKLLRAPSLNPEIAAAVAEAVRIRDKKMETKQNQLGLGITAISRAMNLILNDGKKIEIIKFLSEGSRILTDLHFTETQIRAKCITPSLEKSFLNIIQEDERDEMLFGSKLPEKIKAAKAIEKQGWQIKKNVNYVQKSQQQFKVRPQGNWTPPPRYPSSVSRGGRAVHMTSRAQPSTSYRQFRPPPPPSPQMTQARQMLNKQRAQPRR